MKHGEIRTRTIVQNNGKFRAVKREKYCVVHGWSDLFLCDELRWQKLHKSCGGRGCQATVVNVSEVQAIAKAA